jgi:hypothetical protein
MSSIAVCQANCYYREHQLTEGSPIDPRPNVMMMMMTVFHWTLILRWQFVLDHSFCATTGQGRKEGRKAALENNITIMYYILLVVKDSTSIVMSVILSRSHLI